MSYRAVSEYVSHCRAAGLAENTIDDRRELLMRVSDLGDLDGLGPRDIQRWLTRGGWSPQRAL